MPDQRASIILPDTGEKAVECIGKSSFLRFSQWGRAAGVCPAASHCVQEVPHVELRLDCAGRIFLAAGTQSLGTLRQHLISQGNVGSDNQISGERATDDFIVGDVKPGFDLQHLYIFKWRCL